MTEIRYHAAACQINFSSPTHRREIPSRVKRMGEMISQTVVGYEPFFDVRLLAFPEFSHAVPIHDDPARLAEHLAIELPGPEIEPYLAICRQLGCYVQTGTFLERDSKYPDAVFNTTLLIGPEGVLAKYRKVNPWLPWEVHASPHDFADYDADLFPVVDTPIGKLGTAICYDWLFPEVLRELAVAGAEVMIRVSAYMDPWGATAPMDWWTLFNRARAVENMAYVVASNQGADMSNYPPFSWPGGSMVVDFDGRILAQADPGPGEKVVVAPVDISGLRLERERRRGHQMLHHLRTEAYGYLQSPRLPRADGEFSLKNNDRRIAAARRADEDVD